MEELLQELADAELGKQVMVTVGMAVIQCKTIVEIVHESHE